MPYIIWMQSNDKSPFSTILFPQAFDNNIAVKTDRFKSRRPEGRCIKYNLCVAVNPETFSYSVRRSFFCGTKSLP